MLSRAVHRVAFAAAFALLAFAAHDSDAQVLGEGTGPDVSDMMSQRAVPTFTVSDIKVEGNTSTAASAVIAFSGIRIGDTYRPGEELFADAIKNLFQRKVFSDVKIFAEDQTDSSFVVVIRVREYPRVASVYVDGNDAIDDDDIVDEVSIESGDIADPYTLNRSSRAVEDLYVEEGYLFSDVTIESRSSTEAGRVDLFVTIDEGPEINVGSIAIDGNSQLDDDDVKGAMSEVKEKSWWQFWRSSKLQREKLEEDKQNIVDHYRSKGFIDAEVLGDTIEVNPESGKSDITITVSEGKRYYLRNLRVTGNEVYELKTIERLIDAEEGEPYNKTALENTVIGNAERSVRSLYLDNGYLTFNAEIDETKIGSDSIDVIVKLREGSPAYVRYVDIAGNTKTKDKVIRRELYTVPGEKFSRAAVIRSLRNLANLNYFNPEKLVPDVQQSADATRVDITYEVEERPSDTFNASMGISAQGITGAIGLSFTNFSVTEPLRGGAGQTLNVNAEFGSYVQTYSLGLTEPWLFGKPITLGGNVFYQQQDLSTFEADEFKIERYGVSLTTGARLQWPDDYFRIDAALRLSQNNLIGDQTRSVLFRNGSEYSLSTSLRRSSIDNPIFPSVGSRFKASSVFALFGDAEYVRPELSFEFFSPIAQTSPNNKFVLYLNSEFGHLHPVSSGESISPTVYYTMGGTTLSGYNTVQLRGYGDRSIGPFDQDGFPDGTSYFKSTAEIRYPLAINPIPVYFLTFAEGGNVWGSLSDLNPFELRRSVGIGMRIMMPPIGLLGFDYGYGFDADSRESSLTGSPTPSGWHFHFQFGR